MTKKVKQLGGRKEHEGSKSRFKKTVNNMMTNIIIYYLITTV